MQAKDFTPELVPLVNAALKTGNSKQLEAYMRRRVSEGNEIAVLGDFGRLIGDMCTQPNPPVGALEKLLDGWAARAPASNYIQISAAISAYCQVAVARPEWWTDELRKIRKLARISQPMVAVMVETSMVYLATVNPEQTVLELQSWLEDKNPSIRLRAETIAAALDDMIDD